MGSDFTMTTASPSVRQRGAQISKKRSLTPNPDTITNGDHDFLDMAQQKIKTAVISEWNYKVALAIITVLAFVTRFYGIKHPNQVVFDEVHFGKVCLQLAA